MKAIFCALATVLVLGMATAAPHSPPLAPNTIHTTTTPHVPPPPTSSTAHVPPTTTAPHHPSEPSHHTPPTTHRTCGLEEFRGKDGSCNKCSSCGADEFASSMCSGSNDTQCSKCTPCKDDEKVETRCMPHHNRVCVKKDKHEIPAEHHENVVVRPAEPAPDTNPPARTEARRRCPAGSVRSTGGACVERPCPDGHYRVNNVCVERVAPVQACRAGFYILRTARANRPAMCAACTVCDDSQRVVSPCTLTSDTVCDDKVRGAKPAIGDVQCVGDNGKKVDYFVAIKIPNSGNYWYFDPSTGGKLVRSANDLHKPKGAVYSTLAPIYGKKTAVGGYAMWNDQPPVGDAAGMDFAHSKGVMAFGKEKGFWLIHSMPKFPMIRMSGYDGLSSYENGQSFMCLTLSAKESEKVAKQIRVMRVKVYESTLVKTLAAAHPEFAKLLDGQAADVQQSTVMITTVGGATFQSFAKSKAWSGGKLHLYHDLVAKTLGTDLFVETWRNGAADNAMAPVCTKSGQVYNIAALKLGDDSWLSTSDHSKWAISANKESIANMSDSKKYVCIGGVNMQLSQAKRGGGTACFKNPSLHKQLFQAIQKFEGCKKKL